MTMHRRQFVQALGLPSLGWAGSVLAAPGVQQRLLLVFLRGAYDATNTLVPYTSSFYQEVRPNIALARPGAGQNAALELNADWGLHPVLRESLLPMWRAKSLAFVPFSGLEDESRSHFQMQDKIEIGLGSQARDFSTGFLNRLVSELPQVRAASFTESPTPVLRGPVSASNIGLARAGDRPLVGERQSGLIARMYQGNALASAVQDGFATRDVVQRELGSSAAGREMSARDMAGRDMASAAAREMDAASRGAATPGSFAAVVPRLAKLMSDVYRVGFIDFGRWDTHVNQGAATGQLAERLEELATGLALLERQMGSAWQHTTVVVMSEFGRTFRENGNRGTDHGHGSAIWVMGGAVRGGRVLGEQVPSEARHLHENRDWPVLNDYRSVLGGLFGRLYGLNAAALGRVFPGAKPQDVGLI